MDIVDSKQLAQKQDEELIMLFQKGDIEAYEILVRRFKNPLMNFVYRFTGNYDESDDIVQETFVRVYTHKNSYQPIAKFSTWIYTIASNLAKTRLRQKARIKMLSVFSRRDDNIDFEIEDKSYNLDKITESIKLSEIIQEALNKVAKKYREAVILRDIQDLSYEEIARITGTNIGTVKSRINRGREMLKSLLKHIIEE